MTSANRGRAGESKNRLTHSLVCWTLFYRSQERVPIPALAGLLKALTFKLSIRGLNIIWYVQFKYLGRISFTELYNAVRPATVSSKPDRICNKEQRRGGGCGGGRESWGWIWTKGGRGEKENAESCCELFHQKWSAPVLWGDISQRKRERERERKPV